MCHTRPGVSHGGGGGGGGTNELQTGKVHWNLCSSSFLVSHLLCSDPHPLLPSHLSLRDKGHKALCPLSVDSITTHHTARTYHPCSHLAVHLCGSKEATHRGRRWRLGAPQMGG